MNLLHRGLFLFLAFALSALTPVLGVERKSSPLHLPREHFRSRHPQIREILRAVISRHSNISLVPDEREISPITAATGSSYIVCDYFTGTNNTALIGRLAMTDLPGSPYAGNGNVSLLGGPTGGTPYEADIQSNAARIGADAGLAIDLNNSAPLLMQLSITFNISGDTQTQVDNAHRGAALGFFSSVSITTGGSSHGFNNFTGLAVDRAGNIRLIIGGTDSGIFTSVSGFDPNATHTLAFNINITPGIGSISNILLDNMNVNLLAPTDTFTAARTSYAGFYNSSGSATDLATFDNFIVASVPEPAILTSFALGLLTLRAMRRFDRRLSNE